VSRKTSELFEELDTVLWRASNLADELRRRCGHDPESTPPHDEPISGPGVIPD